MRRETRISVPDWRNESQDHSQRGFLLWPENVVCWDDRDSLLIGPYLTTAGGGVGYRFPSTGSSGS